jgi:CelD/BcsL family acetyltransferase involved in cellulose biosynthesis
MAILVFMRHGALTARRLDTNLRKKHRRGHRTFGSSGFLFLILLEIKSNEKPGIAKINDQRRDSQAN